MYRNIYSHANSIRVMMMMMMMRACPACRSASCKRFRSLSRSGDRVNAGVQIHADALDYCDEGER